VNAQVDQIRRSLGDFENTCLALSHDIRSPLRTISSYADIVLQEHGAELPAEVSQMISRMRIVATKGEAVAQDLLAQARGSLGVKSRTLVTIDLNEIAADATQFLNAQIAATGAEIRIRDRLASVRGYYTGMLQVMVNLMTNGIKYVPAGRRPVIEVWSETKGTEVRLFLRDNGTGLVIGNQPGAIKSNSGAGEQGTGLGLKIVRDAIAALGGRLEIASRPEEGTLLTITLRDASIP
jgi:signal transduction histidine kinase